MKRRSIYRLVAAVTVAGAVSIAGWQTQKVVERLVAQKLLPDMIGIGDIEGVRWGD